MKTICSDEARAYQRMGATCLKGYLTATYDELIKEFGEPTQEGSGDGKVQVEWAVKVNDAIVFIYDYKEYETPVKDVTDWHLGARSLNDVVAFKHILESSNEKMAAKVVSSGL